MEGGKPLHLQKLKSRLMGKIKSEVQNRSAGGGSDLFCHAVQMLSEKKKAKQQQRKSCLPR